MAVPTRTMVVAATLYDVRHCSECASSQKKSAEPKKSAAALTPISRPVETPPSSSHTTNHAALCTALLSVCEPKSSTITPMRPWCAAIGWATTSSQCGSV
eukprot:1488346-Prymnesium_polylepis.1